MAIQKYAILIAGHSPADPGAQGQGRNEADETIQITNRVHDLLLPHPNVFVDVVPHNLDYVDSKNWINSRLPNLDDGINVEIHKNSTVGATGVETYTPLSPDADTTRLATCINNELARTSGLRNRGVKQGGFYLITNTNQRAVLVEAGFMQQDPLDDAADARYAEGIANGICDFFGEPRPSALVKPPVLNPIPPTATPDQLYRLKHGDVQKGAYSSDKNAYSGWEFYGKTGTITLAGKDVTAEVVEKYRPKPTPTPTPVPTVPSRDDLQDAEIAGLKALIKTITDWIASFGKK
jgi:hypothetical protein